MSEKSKRSYTKARDSLPMVLLTLRDADCSSKSRCTALLDDLIDSYYAQYRPVRGPGIFATCPRGREARAVSELYELLERLCDFDPTLAPESTNEDAQLDEDERGDIEDRIARELDQLRISYTTDDPDRGTRRFDNRLTDTECLSSPLDPVKLCEAASRAAIEQMPGIPRPQSVCGSAYTDAHRLLSRLTPVTQTCSSVSLDALDSLARVVLKPVLQAASPSFTAPLSRPVVNDAIARAIRHLGHPIEVNIASPDYVVLVEVFKNVAGISCVENELYDGPRGGKRFGCVGVMASFDDCRLLAAADEAIKRQAAQSEASPDSASSS